MSATGRLTPLTSRRHFVACTVAFAPLMLTYAAAPRPNEEERMTTAATVRGYLDVLGSKQGWDAWLAEDMTFTSFTSPVKHVKGKAAYLRATERFYSSIRRVELRELLVEGDRACALTRYSLQPPNGAPGFESDVAEIFTVRNGQITALAIYFDSAPFPK